MEANLTFPEIFTKTGNIKTNLAPTDLLLISDSEDSGVFKNIELQTVIEQALTDYLEPFSSVVDVNTNFTAVPSTLYRNVTTAVNYIYPQITMTLPAPSAANKNRMIGFVSLVGHDIYYMEWQRLAIASGRINNVVNNTTYTTSDLTYGFLISSGTTWLTFGFRTGYQDG
jgi:hypothetical protein